MQTIFNLPASFYKSQMNLLESYIKQTSFYLSITRNLPIEQAEVEAKNLLRSSFKDKNIKYFQREENQDRTVQTGSLLKYITDTVKEGNIITPTFTTYLNKNVKKSVHSEFITTNVKKRSIAKKLAHKAKLENNKDLFTAKNNEQNMMKIYNNSLSGSFAQSACALYNFTGHSTLTSTTRTVTSLANASNENIIAGNRYYPTPSDVFNNIVYIASNTDVKTIEQVVTKYNLYLPTVEDTIHVLMYSSDLYFENPTFYREKVYSFLSKLTPYHRAAICYTNDLYHLKEFNSKFIRNYIDELTHKVITNEVNDEYIEKINSIDSNILNYVHELFFYEVQGYGKDYIKMNALGLTSNIYNTSLNVYNVLNKYQDFISCFFLSTIMPVNAHRIGYMRRKAVVLSDTDSTCFTLDKWVHWYNGNYDITPKTIAVASSVAFMSTQVIIHILAQLSKNLNISDEDINILAMKNEYLWTVHMPAEVSKHYAAYTVMQEGSVYKTPELEIKGVHLKNSATPKVLVKDCSNLIKSILETVHNNQRVKVLSVINHVIDVENSIAENVRKGNVVYFKKSSIKNKEAYVKGEEDSPFQRHTFWMDVFSSKYGTIPNPPYNVIKIPTTLINKSTFTNWINTIEDKEIQTKLTDWAIRTEKKYLPTIYLETSLIESNGIPKEIVATIDIKKIILDITIQHRIVLESLGVLLDNNLLVSEMFKRT